MTAKHLTAMTAMVRKLSRPRRDRGASNSPAPLVSPVPSRSKRAKSQFGADAICLSVVITGQRLDARPQTTAQATATATIAPLHLYRHVAY